MYFVVEGNFTNSAAAIPSVNDCTGSHSSNFEPNRIAKTGNPVHLIATKVTQSWLARVRMHNYKLEVKVH